MELWYTQPAVDWNAALPAGNGRLGCMQFGGVARERFQLNEDSLWSGGPMHRLNPDASATLPKVQELLRQGRLPDAERLALDGLASTPCGMRAYQPLGDLTLDFDGLPAEADDYCRGLDLDAGTLYVRFTVGGAHYAREAFVSYPDGVFVLRLTTDAPPGTLPALPLGPQAPRRDRTLGRCNDLFHGRFRRHRLCCRGPLGRARWRHGAGCRRYAAFARREVGNLPAGCRHDLP